MTEKAFNPLEIRKIIFGIDTLVELPDGKKVAAINFDNGATTPPLKPVVERIEKELLQYGSIGRGTGQKSSYTTQIYTDARDIVKKFLGAQNDAYTVFFTNCTTDGMNKLSSALICGNTDNVLCSRMEHHANDLPWRERTKLANSSIFYIDVKKDGRLRIEDYEKVLKENCNRPTKIKYVTVTAASNVSGYINDIHAIAATAHKYGAQIVVDGAQIVAHRPVSMIGRTPQENIDYFVFSAHKMYSPFGGGAVVGLTDELNKHIPVFYGGGMVYSVKDDSVTYTDAPDLYEAGSPNYPGVVGMAESMKMLSKIGFDNIVAHEKELMKLAIEGLKKINGVVLYADNDNYDDRVGTVVFNLTNSKGEEIPNAEVAKKLAQVSAIAVRHAAFCAHTYVRRLTGEQPVEDSVGGGCFPPNGMVRVSFGIYNTPEEVKTLLETIKALLNASHPMRFTTNVADRATKDKRPNDRA